MKLRFAFLGLLSLIAMSCSYEESFVPEDNNDNSAVDFYATFDEQPNVDTKVYADENLKVLWNADDRITIFNKIAYNQEYRFAGENGDNAGAFKKVPNEGFITGTELDKVYAVYPYRESTKISNSSIITTAIPSEQTSLANSFGRGANTMVACAGDNVLRFKNVGGYLSLKFYGEGVSVSSITLKSNNGELIAGDCTVDMSSGLPVSNLITANASDAITMVCDPPIELPAEKTDAVMAIFVLSPGTLTGGITVTVTTSDGGVFEKSTSNKLEIGRSAITRLGALEVVPEYVQPNSVIYYTSSDGEIVTPNASDVFGANIVDNKYENGRGILTFDGDITSIGGGAFMNRSNLTGITIPETVKEIGGYAFDKSGLISITLPEGSSIKLYESAFRSCNALSTVRFEGEISFANLEEGVFAECPITDLYFGEGFDYNVPSGVLSYYSLYYYLFMKYNDDFDLSLCSIEVSSLNRKYDSRENSNALIETATNTLILGCKNTSIPESVTCIGSGAFSDLGDMSSFVVPANVSSIGAAFDQRLASITVQATTPPTITDNGPFSWWYWNYDDQWNRLDHNTIIFVPAGSVNVYKAAPGWSEYADRIQAIPLVPVPEAVDLGLPSGLKWASFNLGASKPEEYGDYYAWGETEPYYSHQEPLTWKEGKESGYSLSSYKWCTGDSGKLTKYCTLPSMGYNDFTDDKTVLDPEDDAAHIKLGGSWRMPTIGEWKELMENCTWTWTTQNGVAGRLVTARNGNSIFLPATGFLDGTNPKNVATVGYYWSSSLFKNGADDSVGRPEYASPLCFTSGFVDNSSIGSRNFGFSVRSVYVE